LTYPPPQPCLSSDREFTPVVRDAIRDLPILERFDYLFERDEYDRPLAPTRNPFASLMRGLIEDPIDRSKRRKSPSILTGCSRTRHSADTIRRFSATAEGSAEPISRYIRLAWNQIAPTIRAGTGADHGSHTAPRPIHPRIPRCISVREAARLHSLPDWFQFHGTRWHDFRQIGNSVPPLLARAVACMVAQAVNSI
jgi:DNA (cytosine-5)-methyltransferase 1